MAVALAMVIQMALIIQDHRACDLAGLGQADLLAELSKAGQRACARVNRALRIMPHAQMLNVTAGQVDQRLRIIQCGVQNGDGGLSSFHFYLAKQLFRRKAKREVQLGQYFQQLAKAFSTFQAY